MLRVLVVTSWVACISAARETNAQGNRPATRPPGGPTRASTTFDVEVRIRVAAAASKIRVAQWAELLKEAGAASVREVAAETLLLKPKTPVVEEPIELVGGRIVVKASIDLAGTLRIGDTAYRAGQAEPLAAFIKKLHTEGLPAPDPTQPRWGLRGTDWESLVSTLRTPAGTAIKDLPIRELLDQTAQRCRIPIRLSDAANAVAARARVTADTGALTTGSSLAYALGTVGLIFEPRSDGAGTVALLVRTEAESEHPWPVGFLPNEFPGNVAPVLFQKTSYAARETTLAEYVVFLRKELSMDVMVHGRAIARRGMDPRELKATAEFVDQAWATTLRQFLGSMGLKHEIRFDEAGKAFVWITVSDVIGPRPGAGASDVRRK